MTSYKKLCDRNSPEGRWAHYGPYYAMFPLEYTYNVIEKYSNTGEIVLDPFAGRFSSNYVGACLGRNTIGIEINPVGWLYGKTKMHPAPLDKVLNRLSTIYHSRNDQVEAVLKMPEFYRICFCNDVLAFLLNARELLDWRRDNVDSTLMSFLMVYLHGKRGDSLSNQMQITKSMGMKYSIGWWKRKGLTTPPEINALEYLSKRINWRYAKGLPKFKTNNSTVLGDSTIMLNDINTLLKQEKVSLLFTSPPYCGITDYHADQWLRLWLLGGPEQPSTIQEKYRNRFNNKEEYEELLSIVFAKCSKLMAKKSFVCVRTDARDFTLKVTKKLLKKYFPDYSFQSKVDTLKADSSSQTKIYGNKSSKPAEVDIILGRQ